MAEIINSPIVLDSTGQSILGKLRTQNGLLSMLAEEKRQNIYSDISTLAYTVRSNDLATLKEMFPVGDQIIVPWKDMDDSAHNTDETAYQVAWDFLDVREVTKKNGSVVPGLVLGMHLCSAYNLQFDACEAFYVAKEALPAGTYHVTFEEGIGNQSANASWQFTLTQEVPAGGLLSGFVFVGENPSSYWHIQSWTSGDAASPIETVGITSGEEGTSLGTMRASKVSDSGLNSLGRTGYGSNRWSTSAIRQYLNSSGTGWWKSQEDFDIRPDEYAKHGFMSGFGDDFLSAIKPVKVVTVLNHAEGFTDTTEETYDIFFLPSLEEINATPHVSGAEGPYFPYWRERLGLNGFAKVYAVSSPYDAYKITSISGDTSYRNMHLRTPNIYSVYGTMALMPGYIGGAYANYGSYHFIAVCVVC